MRERPILFSGPMVRAILEGRKTMTRRIVKPQPPSWMSRAIVETFTPAISRGGDLLEGPPHFGAHDGEGEWGARCPYGAPGDRLWVREAWAPLNRVHWPDLPHTVGPDRNVAYYREGFDRSWDWRWRPSIHMPRWASRLALDVVGVRVERLRDISEADIAAEGVTVESVRALWDGATRAERRQAWGADVPPIDAFAPTALWHLGWSLINGEASYEANPWVWVVEFRRVEPAARAA